MVQAKPEFSAAKERNDVHQPSLQIFSGIHGVVRVDSLASVAMQGQPTAALVFMSFNDALTQSLLNTVYPTRLFLINGKPPVHSWRENAMAWIHDHVRRECGTIIRWTLVDLGCRQEACLHSILPIRLTHTPTRDRFCVYNG